MTWVETSFSLGGAGAYKAAIDAMVAAGWTIVDGATAAAGPASALDGLTSIQNGIASIRSAAQTAVGVDMALPSCWIRPTLVQREVISSGAVTTLTEGVDYSMDYRRGTIRALGGGWANNSTQRFLIAAGNYTIRRGWLVLSSVGVSGQETQLLVGVRFDGVGALLSGPRWCLFKEFTVGNSFDVVDDTKRSPAEVDVRCFIDQALSGSMYAAVDADRFCGSFSIPEAHNAWVYAGTLQRIRTVLQQSCASALMGNQAERFAEGLDANGVVGDADNAGWTSDTGINGSAWAYYEATPRFGSRAVAPLQLNVNRWSRGTEGAAADVPQSEIRIDAAENFYFELHPVIVGKYVENLNLSPAGTNGYIIGIAKGLRTFFQSHAQSRSRVNYLGSSWAVLRVGRSPTRFVAVERV